LIADAVDWAVFHGARVVCIALGTGASKSLHDAVQRGIESDVVIVAAAGNDPSAGIQAPARYEGVVAAVGVDRTGARAPFSATGSAAVLAAPAVDIISTDTGGKYSKSFGTSDATAIIAGVAALVRSKFPELSAKEVIHRMTATAIDKGKPGRDEEYGYGIVNPVGALTADVPPLRPSPSSSPPTADSRPPAPKGNNSSTALAWIIGGVLLAAAGVGAAIAIERARSQLP
jgi:subtilisin family serine protease